MARPSMFKDRVNSSIYMEREDKRYIEEHGISITKLFNQALKLIKSNKLKYKRD